MIGQKRRKPVLGQLKKPLVVPKRVVRIKGNCGDGVGHIVRCLFSKATGTLYRPIQEADKFDDDGDTSVITDTKPKTKRPPLYKVMLLNDDFTPMEFVVLVLERFFGLNSAQAFEIMLTVHQKGLAVVGVFSHEIAETKVAQVMDFARRHQHPLQCTMEKEE
jgi:ATP-dependent Clp protease adaptor protein ClpS